MCVYNKSYTGGGDGFIAKLNSDLTELAAATFIGGSGLEEEVYGDSIRKQ